MRLFLSNFCLFCFLHLSLAQTDSLPYVHVLGIAQDGGYPHAGCQRTCCAMAWDSVGMKRKVVSFAYVDPIRKQWWLFEATPDFREQLQDFRAATDSVYNYLPDGIFLTHAHVGHYTGLLHLGREIMGAKAVPVYCLPKMADFLRENGPWSQLVDLKNIEIRELKADSLTDISPSFSVQAMAIPHRDEFSETAGFVLCAPSKCYLFIPDIDKWEKWERDIVTLVKLVDVAFVDATFYQDGELPNRSMAEVPHPFVEETMKIFENEPENIRNRLHFIHLNHTNPLLWDEKTRADLEGKGFRVAKQGGRY